ncbi:MAG: formate--tetrahydrofolate ligase [Acidobacteria bacterium]|nr:formate--tetrahydrofolate ligase [Acidobacteriota bacterium]
MLPISEIAEKLAINQNYLDYYGKHIAKLKLSLLADKEKNKDGKIILVTAMTPTKQGEGKTVVSIGLAQAIAKLGKHSIVTLREPSLGPLFGIKGGATGGGKSQVLPNEKINLHFTGDFHAITSAHNLISASLDSHIYHGNNLNIDINNCFWPRALDMNDRVLRHIIVGLGGSANGIPRESGFVITAASEIMAILALANSQADLRNRLNEIVLALDLNGKAVTVAQLDITGALMVLLNDAILPNLVQTSENTPAIIHAGPFANIAHGTSSILAQKMALKLADYVVNECGFAADLGAEKYLNIVMRQSDLKPSAAVLVVTAKAVLAQDNQNNQNTNTYETEGFSNLTKHIENLRKFNLSVVVAVNRFPDDKESELNKLIEFCQEIKIPVSIVNVFNQGGEGALDLASKVIDAASKTDLSKINSLYPSELSLFEKIQIIAKEIYGASNVELTTIASKKLKKFAELGFSNLPICIAKTQYSLSDNAKLFGAPKGWILNITDAQLSAGAGFVVAIAGNMMLMPGLPKLSQATKMDVTDEGQIIF